MQLMGSRLTRTDDPFSDWDYLVESEADFEEMSARSDSAIVSILYDKGPLRILTLIDGEGTLWDFTGSHAAFPEHWDRLAASLTDKDLNDYWVIAFKVLKAVYRDHPILADLGLELAVSAARDLYMDRRYNTRNYKDFFAFKTVATQLASDQTLSRVTGMAYATRAEKLLKIDALADLVAGLGDGSNAVRRVFGLRLQTLG